MKLRTQIEIAPFERQIEYSHQIFMIGSCFAQNIGERMQRAKFCAEVNPTGTLFNPLSICNTLARLHSQQFVKEEELREGAQGWYHYDFHSSLNGATPNEALANINTAIVKGGRALREAHTVVITLGTAWVYQYGDMVVANCHKEPARNFIRRRASIGEITTELSKAIGQILPDKSVILTISPIRHIADGLEQNSLSKATLRMAIEQIVATYPDRVRYFPSYEIMMDDLRDYRFYAEDMVHPSPLAVEYIWDLFAQAALSSRARETMQRVMKIVVASQHRPIAPTSEAHKRHCEAQLRAIEELSAAHTAINFGKEIEYFGGSSK